MNATKQSKPRGPAKRRGTVVTSLVLEEDMVQWGKEQPGGLSELVRALLREAYERRPEKRLAHTAHRSFAEGTRHLWDTPEEDEAWQHLQEVK